MPNHKYNVYSTIANLMRDNLPWSYKQGMHWNLKQLITHTNLYLVYLDISRMFVPKGTFQQSTCLAQRKRQDIFSANVGSVYQCINSLLGFNGCTLVINIINNRSIPNAFLLHMQYVSWIIHTVPCYVVICRSLVAFDYWYPSQFLYLKLRYETIDWNNPWRMLS